MTKNINYVSHKKSKVKNNGKPQLPSANSLVEGEIAINYAKDVETLSIKNESGTVVTFSSDNYYTEKKLGSGFTESNSAVTVTSAIFEIEKAISDEASRATAAESVLSSGKADKATTLAGYGITDAYTKSQTYTKTEVNGLVSTPHQNYVTVATYADLPATGSADTIYRVSNWDGSANSGAGAVDITVYSEYAWDDASNPNKYVFLCVKSQIGEVFDISVYNNNAKYDTLADALGTNGEHVPQSIRRGGMSVKYVQNSDNKYIQYRLMSDSFNTTPANWQGVDSKPTSVSHNLIESGGVYNAIKKEHTDITEIKNAIGNDTTIQYTEYDLVSMFYNGSIVTANETYDGIQIKVKKGDIYNSAATIVSSRFNASPFEVGGSIGSEVSFPFTADSDGYLLFTIRIDSLPITVTKEATGFQKNINSLNSDVENLKEECGEYINFDILQSSDRVSQAIYLGNPGKTVKFKVSLKSGTDEGLWSVFGTNQDVTSLDVSVILTSNNTFGETKEFIVPSNGYVWLFTTATSSAVRTYNVVCELETSLNNKIIALQRKDVEIEVELNKLDNEIFGNKYTETVSRDRLSQSLYIGHEDEEVFVSMIVESGTDTGDYAIYGTTNNGESIDISNVLVSHTPIGGSAKMFTVPSDGYIWLFTWDSSLQTQRVYEVAIMPVSSITVQINTLFGLTKKKLDGKTIVCFGDSITEFEYHGKGYTDWLADITGANVINVGIGGTQIRQRLSPTLTPTNSDQAYANLDIINMVKAATSQDFRYVRAGAEYLVSRGDDNTAIVERLANIDWSSVDYAILFAGTNDWTGNNGNTGAVDSIDINYTCGALNKIIELLNAKYKKVQFYYFTPIIRVFVPDFSDSVQYQVGDRCRYGSPYYKFINAHQGAWNASDVEETTNMESRVAAYYSNNLKVNGKTLREFSELLYTVVRNNNVPVCDMYNTLGWNLYNFNNFFDNTDSTHPFKGFEQIAEKISKFILSN